MQHFLTKNVNEPFGDDLETVSREDEKKKTKRNQSPEVRNARAHTAGNTYAAFVLQSLTNCIGIHVSMKWSYAVCISSFALFNV